MLPTVTFLIASAVIAAEPFDFDSLPLDARLDLSAVAMRRLEDSTDIPSFRKKNMLVDFDRLPQAIKFDLAEFYESTYAPSIENNKWTQRVFDPAKHALDSDDFLYPNAFHGSDTVYSGSIDNVLSGVNFNAIAIEASKNPMFNTDDVYTRLYLDSLEYHKTVKYAAKRFKYWIWTTRTKYSEDRAVDAPRISEETQVQWAFEDLKKRGKLNIVVP